jgi:hypothetical protein
MFSVYMVWHWQLGFFGLLCKNICSSTVIGLCKILTILFLIYNGKDTEGKTHVYMYCGFSHWKLELGMTQAFPPLKLEQTMFFMETNSNWIPVA